MTDLRELLYLLYDAHNRVRTVHGVYDSWEDEDLNNKAFTRDFPKDPEFEEYESARPKRPAYETTAELWLEWPDRVRENVRSSREGQDHILVTKNGELWQYFPRSGVNRQVGGHARHVSRIDVFDPAFLLVDLRLQPIGRGAAAGRDAITVRIRPRSSFFDHGFEHLDLLEEVVVDAERGTLLSGTWRLDGEDMHWFRFTAIEFDSPIPPQVFAPDVPSDPKSWGADFPKPVAVSLEEGAARASFGVWALPAVPDGWVAQYSWREGHPEQQETFFVTYARRDATARIELEQAAARELNENEIKQTLEKNGRTIQVDRFGDVMVELDGTLIEIHSALPLERLLDVAAKLVPVS